MDFGLNDEILSRINICFFFFNALKISSCIILSPLLLQEGEEYVTTLKSCGEIISSIEQPLISHFLFAYVFLKQFF